MEKRQISTTIRLCNINYLFEKVNDFSFQVSYSLDTERKSIKLPSNYHIVASSEDEDYCFSGALNTFIKYCPDLPVVISADIEVELEEEARAIVPFISISGIKTKAYNAKKSEVIYYFQDKDWLDAQIIRTIGVPNFKLKRIDFRTKNNFFPNLINQSLSSKHAQPYTPDEINDLHSYANQAVMEAALIFNPALTNRFVGLASHRIKYAFADLWVNNGKIEQLDHKRQKAFMLIRKYLQENPSASMEELLANLPVSSSDYEYYEKYFIDPPVELDGIYIDGYNQKLYDEILSIPEKPKSKSYKPIIKEILTKEGVSEDKILIYLDYMDLGATPVMKKYGLKAYSLNIIKEEIETIIKKHPKELNPNYIE